MTAILVIGGTGKLGRPVVRALHAAGVEVRVLTRSLENAQRQLGDDRQLGATYELIEGDVEDIPSLEQALDGCQGVHINLDGGSDPDLERRGAVNTAQAARKSGVERISYLSGASVCEENRWYAGTRARFQAEAALRESGVPYTVFRSHFFMETLPNFVHGKRVLQIGRHPHPYPWVAADDYARMVARAYALPEAANRIFYVLGPQLLTMRQALEIFQSIIHPDKDLMSLPLPVAEIMARLGRRKALQAALPFFHYCDKVKIITSGSADEANDMLGAPTTTLETWCRNYHYSTGSEA